LLLQLGEADPNDRIETWRGSTKCLSAPVWVAAKLRVSEDVSSGPTFRKYEDPEQVRARLRSQDGV